MCHQAVQWAEARLAAALIGAKRQLASVYQLSHRYDTWNIRWADSVTHSPVHTFHSYASSIRISMSGKRSNLIRAFAPFMCMWSARGYQSGYQTSELTGKCIPGISMHTSCLYSCLLSILPLCLPQTLSGIVPDHHWSVVGLVCSNIPITAWHLAFACILRYPHDASLKYGLCSNCLYSLW